MTELTDEAVFPMTDDDDTPELIGMAMDGSLDAALRLHEALLPGWDYHLWNLGTDEAGADVAHHQHGQIQDSAISSNQARAWLLAILRALESMEDPGDGWTWHERLGWIGPDGKPADPRRRG